MEEIVFHSIRHTSAGVKLRLSNGDLKAVQGDGGWSTPDMVTKRYAHILDEDRRTLAAEMEKQFYQTAGNLDAPKAQEQPAEATPIVDETALVTLLTSNPELLTKVLQSIQLLTGLRFISRTPNRSKEVISKLPENFSKIPLKCLGLLAKSKSQLSASKVFALD